MMSSRLTKAIKDRMYEKNFSIAALEREAGLKIHAVRNILSGHSKRPSAETLKAIAHALDCKVDDLLEGRTHGEDKKQKIEEKSPTIEFPQVLLECLELTLKVLEEGGYRPTIQQLFFIVEEVYFYSIKSNSPKIDKTFIRWFVAKTLD